MALIKWTGQDVWEPFRDLEELQTEMSRLFGRGGLPVSGWGGGNGGKWLPNVDIVEEKDHIVVKADLPGIKQEDISVEIDEHILTIKGERKQESEKKEGQCHRIERSYGEFLRSFSLPVYVDASKVNAAYKNGVLEVTLLKREGAKAKQVKVEVK